MIKTTTILCFLILVTSVHILNAQQFRGIDNKGTIIVVKNTRVTTANTAPLASSNLVVGDVWFDASVTPNRLNIWDGTQWINGFSAIQQVTNELIFEDDDYCYVSLLINMVMWEVTRYTRADINEEVTVRGTGAQPSSLADVQALTY